MKTSGDYFEEALMLIRKAINKAGSERKLAKAISVKPETVRNWVSLTTPSLTHLEKVRKFLNEKVQK